MDDKDKPIPNENVTPQQKCDNLDTTTLDKT